jgi:hypothetical protein
MITTRSQSANPKLMHKQKINKPGPKRIYKSGNTVQFNKHKENLIKHLKMSKSAHVAEVMKQHCMKDAHIYCVLNKLPAQQFGPLLEKFIIKQRGHTKNNVLALAGDCNDGKKNYEIKVSLGGFSHNKFNFVQLRPSHDIDNYILTAYHLTLHNVDNGGDLYVFDVPKEKMKALILAHGGYAHGTLKDHGKIRLNKKCDRKEYALRPTYGDKCWKSLLMYVKNTPLTRLASSWWL